MKRVNISISRSSFFLHAHEIWYSFAICAKIKFIARRPRSDVQNWIRIVFSKYFLLSQSLPRVSNDSNLTESHFFRAIIIAQRLSAALGTGLPVNLVAVHGFTWFAYNERKNAEQKKPVDMNRIIFLGLFTAREKNKQIVRIPLHASFRCTISPSVSLRWIMLAINTNY